MDQAAQIVVTGFHRSGTSMAMQALKKAGLDIGDSLLGAAPSNPDGHFEDIEAVKLHDTWLADAGTDWCCTEQLPAVDASDAKRGIESISQRLGAEQTTWGMKDPRAALYLNEWFNQLSNPYAVLVYRHFASCASSLQRRQAGTLFTQPSDKHDRIRFWMDPHVALKSWLVHNQAILKHIKNNPDRCVLVSQESQLAGFNLASIVASRFPINLRVDSESGVDINKSTFEKTITLDAKPLQQALEDTWAELQNLSQAPAATYPSVDWSKPAEDVSDEAVSNALAQLHASWDKLGVPASH